MNLQILLGLELLVTDMTRDVFGLHGVNVHDVLLQIRIIRVYLAAFRALGFTVLIGVIYLMLLMIPSLRLLMEYRHALDLVLCARLQHQIQLIALGSGSLLKALEIVLQFLMHHRQLFIIQAVEGIEGVLRRLLAGGMVMMMLMMLMVMLEKSRKFLPFRVVTPALVSSRPGVLVSRRGRTWQPTGTRA